MVYVFVKVINSKRGFTIDHFVILILLLLILLHRFNIADFLKFHNPNSDTYIYNKYSDVTNSKLFWIHECSYDPVETKSITAHYDKSSDNFTLSKILELLFRLPLRWPKESQKFRQCILAFLLP